MTSPVVLSPVIEVYEHRRSPQSKLDYVVLRGSIGLLMFAPLAFGAVEPWSIFTLQVGCALLFLLWAGRQAWSGVLHITWNPLFLPMLAFAALIVFQLIAGKTVYREATRSVALLYAAYGCISFLIVQSLHRHNHVKGLAAAISAYGFAVAVFAIFQDAAFNGKIYWVRTPYSGGWIYGPYVNHNHYAGLMEMLTPIPLVISLSRNVPRDRRILAAFSAAVMASTIFLSGSRGGMIALAAQVMVLAAVVIKRRSVATTLSFGAFVLMVCLLLSWLGGNQLVERVASINRAAKTEVSGGVRLQIDRDTIRMFAARPVLGWGLGTFSEVHPQFRSFYTNLQVNAAHNDYLQLLAETGGLGFAIMLWFLLTLFRHAIAKIRVWPQHTNSAIALAAMLGVTGILVHGLVDFNLQVPANATFFYVLCAVAVMDGRFQHPRQHRIRHLSALCVDLSGSSKRMRG